MDSWIDKDKTNGKLLTLVFEPMPKNTKAVDLIEGFDRGAFRFLGIHDRRKPLDIKPFAYDADKLKPLFDNFYRSDTVCIKGVIEGYSRNDGYSGLQMYYTNNLTLEDIPLSIDIDENGMFMRKFVIDYPIRNNLYTDNNRRVVPVFITPGDTLELTVGRDGFIDYRYSSGRPFEMASSLNYSLDPFTLYSYMDRSNDANAMTMEQYAGRIETKMNEAYKVLDYMASRFAYNDMDYMMSKTAYDVHFLVSFLDYTMLRDDFRNIYFPTDELMKNDTVRQVFTPEYYQLLRKLDINNPYLLSHQNFFLLQNRYSFLTVFRKSWGRMTVDVDGSPVYEPYTWEAKADIMQAVDSEIFGMPEPSMLFKVHMLNEIYKEFGSVNYSSEINDSVRLDDKAKIERFKALSGNKFMQEKADKIYDSYCNIASLTYSLPECEATAMLRKITDRYRGKYVYIDFWATSCGPCRAAIEHSKHVREELRDHPELEFVFITSDKQSPEGEYNEYVAKHLQGEECYRVPHNEYAKYMELFHFLGIPHYETLDKNGNVLRTRQFVMYDKDSYLIEISRFNKLLGNASE